VFYVLKDEKYVPMILTSRDDGVLYFQKESDLGTHNEFEIKIMDYIRKPSIIKLPKIGNAVDLMLKYGTIDKDNPEKRGNSNNE
jgi:hypothetical protein